MSPEQTLLFSLTCLGFGFIPGPALLQTVSLTLQHGRRAGFLSALGIHLGAFFQICIVALGAVAVLKTAISRAQGGWRRLPGLARHPAHPRARRAGCGDRRAAQRCIVERVHRGVESEVSAVLFSFLLQFTDPHASLGLGWQLFLLGACANLLFSAADVFCILLAHPFRTRVLPGGQALRIGQFLAGTLFVVLGALAIVSG
ncbi:MAG: Threonine efflux protein [uncultured Paraburkholderia sp.]|nr:MAG: Threonine efflux protein [uncultured Paraburkholderia sp.]CAH2910784.1 MAG: Threonine efflux protein [uncultured Paraburkholderia sp.]